MNLVAPQTGEEMTALIDAIVAGFASVPAQDGWTAELLDPADVASVEGQALAVTIAGGHCAAIIARKSLATAIDLEFPDRGFVGVLAPALMAIVAALGGTGADEPVKTTAAELRTQLSGDELVAVSVLDDGSQRATVVLGRTGTDGNALRSQQSDQGGAAVPDAAEGMIVPQAVTFPPIEPPSGAGGSAAPVGILSDVQMGVSVELGRARMSVREILGLTLGSVIELDRPAGAPVDLFVNGTLIARGEVVVIDEEFGVRVSEVIGYRADGPGR